MVGPGALADAVDGGYLDAVELSRAKIVKSEAG